MSAKNFLRAELEKIKENFANAIFKYEFLDVDNTHIIETKPQNVFDCDSFLDFRIDLRNNFRMRFPQDNILFVSEESLNEITTPEFVICKYKMLLTKKKAHNYILANEIVPVTKYAGAGENNYALAA